MSDIPWMLSSHEQLMHRLGQASYGDAPAATRATMLAMGRLATPADLAGLTATVGADVQAINIATNAEVTAIHRLGQKPTMVTVGETQAAIAWLADMEVLHETARFIGSTRLYLIDTTAMISRIDPVLDFCGPEPDYGIGHESDTYGYGEAA